MQENRFLLRGLSHSQIVQRYLSGEFKIKKTISEAITISTVDSIVNPQICEKYDKNIFNPIHCIDNQIFAAAGHQHLQLFFTNQFSNDRVKRCDFCKCDFTSEQIGYPLYHKSQTFIRWENGQSFTDKQEVFWMDGCFDSYNCALAYINKHLVNSANLEMRNSRYLLLNLFHLQYPQQKLVASNDINLQLENGGSLNDEEFRKYSYFPCNKQLLVPILSYHQRFIEKIDYQAVQQARNYNSKIT